MRIIITRTKLLVYTRSGAIGAAIVIVFVVAVAAVLGVTIGVPLLIVAAAAGIIAGAVNALYAGDSFNFLKGMELAD